VSRVPLRRVLAGAALVGVLGGGCGVRGQADAERIAAHDVPFGLTNEAPSSTVPNPGGSVVVYLVRGAQLVPVARDVTSEDPEEALAVLLNGPTPDETRSGYTSAVPAAARLNGVTVRNGTATVDLAGEFLQSNVGDSALGIAQIVDTLARFPEITSVRFELDGKTVGVPKGDGTITRGAVTPSDYPPPSS
jgi:spore germination protein GerM